MTRPVDHWPSTPAESLTGTRWTRRNPAGDEMDRVRIAAVIDAGEYGLEFAISPTSSFGIATGEMFLTSDRDGNPREVEKRVAAITATIDSFMAVYQREDEDGEAAAEKLRDISARLEAL